jgi:hypothetical protein
MTCIDMNYFEVGWIIAFLQNKVITLWFRVKRSLGLKELGA